jgi:hypothetical protein
MIGSWVRQPASILAAEKTKAATLASAEQTRQASIDSANRAYAAGGSYAAFAAANRGKLSA